MPVTPGLGRQRRDNQKAPRFKGGFRSILRPYVKNKTKPNQMLQVGGRLRDGEGRARHHLQANGSAVSPEALVRFSDLLGDSSYLRAA